MTGPSIDRDALRQALSTGHWHQRWEVVPGVFTPGHNSVAHLMEAAEVPPDLTGSRVLDVGTYNGCCAFECERRGAKDVMALDIMNPDRTGFSALREVLGSNVRYCRTSVYELDPEQHGVFDLVLFFGVLYHLRYPHLALDRIRTVCRRDLRVETHVLDGRFAHPRRWARILGRWAVRAARPIPLWRQYRAYELHPEDGSNQLGPNVAAVVASLTDCGFEARVLHTRNNRATLAAEVLPGAATRVARASYEARHPYSARLAGVPLRADPLFDAPGTVVPDQQP